MPVIDPIFMQLHMFLWLSFNWCNVRWLLLDSFTTTECAKI